MKMFLFLLVFFPFLIFSQVKEGFTVSKNPKIGLALSGGGAKGFAHIGVLKVIDSLGIKIDYISGTSMGAIVGGLYASGYKAKDIEKIVMDTDFYTIIANEKTRQETTFFNKANDKYLLSVPIKDGKVNVLPKSISTGQKNIYMLKELFKNVSSIDDFSKLPIPFMCIGTNLESGKMEIFEKGDLINSIMASSAFPSLIDPVKIGDSLYIDGAMTVNYPAKPLKNKGIDIVIGVDLSQGLSSRDQLNSAVSILNQVIDFGIQKETKAQYNYVDINIHPDLTGKSATSYDAKKEILDSGYVEAKKYEQIIAQLPKSETNILRSPISNIFSNVYKINSLEVANSSIFNNSYVQGKMNLKLPSMQTYGSINKMIDKLYATNNYRLINYDIVQNEDGNTLKLTVTEDNSRFFLKFGLHYDEVFKTGLLSNITIKRLLFRNSTISLDLVIGDNTRYYFNYFIDNGYLPGFGAYASGMTFDLKNYKGDVTEKWKWFRNEVYLQSIWKDRYAIGGGISFDYFDSYLNSTGITTFENYINPYVFVKSDTQDDKDFPTKGLYMNLEGKVLDLLNDDVESKSFQAKGEIKIAIPVSNWFSNIVKLDGGFTLGDNISKFYEYRVGGIFAQNLGNLISTPGFELGEKTAKNILQISNSLQFKVYKNFYLIPNLTAATSFDNIQVSDLFKTKFGSAGIAAGYKSPFGQIKINYNKAFNNLNGGHFTVILGHWF